MSVQRNLPTRATAQSDHIKPPEMPTCDRHRQTLATAFAYPSEAHLCELIPVNDCRAIISEVQAATVPATPKLAAQFTGLLMGSYPVRELGDAAIFSEVIKNTFAEFPADIGLHAIDQLTRTLKFFPTRADLVEVLEEIMKRRRHARHVAEAHLREHQRRGEARERARAEKARIEAEKPVREARWPFLRVVHSFEEKFTRGHDTHKPQWMYGVDRNIWFRAVEDWVGRFGVDEVMCWHQVIADMPKPPSSIMAELERMAGEAERAAQK